MMKNIKKMKSSLLVLGLCVALHVNAAETEWSPKGDKIKTEWADKLTPDNVWQSYPRPQLKRAEWMNLNGLWNYSVTGHDVKKKSVEYSGQILVPFAIESSLSGVMKSFLPTDKLWYKRNFSIDDKWKNKDIILHFGAVDYECQVWVNNKLVGSHKGGNNPFSFNITKYLKRNGEQTVEVSVVDPTDTESISRGKQQLDQKEIWYTPVSGIWQTVWIEAVNKTCIKQVLPVADIYKKSVKLSFDVENSNGKEDITVDLLDNGKVVKTVKGKSGDAMEIPVPNAVLWTPSSPKLYHINISMSKSGKEIDRVSSYFTLRKVDIKKDDCGYKRICLNDEPVFQMGTLDQGWWPDGLLTPPSEEAMLYDMVQLKKMGFNTIRKHIKVEPEQYYYYADSLGMMMWQDMVSGFATSRKNVEHVKADAKEDWNAPAEHSAQWQAEMFDMIDRLKFYSCITTWVVFNEGWGQHNTKEIVEKVMDYDKSRIIDGVTGWTDRGVGHMYDVHNYPVSSMVLPENNGNRISVLGEFGGYGWAIDGHLWDTSKRNWGYKNIDGAMALIDNYGRLMFDVESLISQGLAAAIYTQTTDVEGEVNGLMTYDRKITKIPVSLLHAMHSKLYKVNSSKPEILIVDGQNGKKHKAVISIDGAEKQEVSLPFPIEKKGVKVCSETDFESDKKYENLSLWLNVAGDVKVWLNGVEVFNQNVVQTRHYNQFNLSDYADYLKLGKNNLKIEVKANKKMKLDYGLRAF